MSLKNHKLAIFISGEGSNMLNIIDYFSNTSKIKVEVSCVLTNNPQSKGILKLPKEINSYIFSKKELNSGLVLEKLKTINPDLIILAGFLLKVPEDIIKEFPNKILNIHPSLLPKYGGKGMYGDNVHKSVIANQEKETGITIHYVNENYDEGAIISQHSCNLNKNETLNSLKNKIKKLEQTHFPTEIEKILTVDNTEHTE